MEEKWVAIVYNGGDKVGSRIFEGEESQTRPEARRWVISQFGEGTDWSFHHVIER